MRFDWPAFLQQRQIEFVTAGPNTARGHISIKCPLCGHSDPSQHLGISLEGKGWGCLRNSAHRGRAPERLVQILLRCSLSEAKRLVYGEAAVAPTVDALQQSLNALRQLAEPEQAFTPDAPLRLLKEFKPLDNGSVFAQPFRAYLQDRGYRDAQISWLSDAYRLHYATQGLYAYRIIIPIYDRYGELLSWTARAILPDTQPRYRTLRVSADGDGPVAKLASNNTILGLPVLWAAPEPRVLLLVEGPFDALKVTTYGRGFGVYAAALFGLNVYPAQAAEVEELMRRFDAVYLLLDEDAELQRLRLLSRLPEGVKTLRLPPGTDDPGELTAAQVAALSLRLLGDSVDLSFQ